MKKKTKEKLVKEIKELKFYQSCYGWSKARHEEIEQLEALIK